MYILLRVPKSWGIDAVSTSCPENARGGLLKHSEDWDEGLKDLIRNCDD